jgi:hypothetical protein
MRELFIYYRVQPSQADALRAAVAGWHAQLRRTHPGLIARLLVRSDGDGTVQTWMETYSTDPQRLPGGVDARLQAQIEREAQRVAMLIDGPRHAEVFTACAS